MPSIYSKFVQDKIHSEQEQQRQQQDKGQPGATVTERDIK